MIIWINGPYGVGKTTLAEQLIKISPPAMLFDAEAVGNAVRDNMPKKLFRGWIFEDYPAWHRFCSELLSEIACGYNGDIYVPMTLVYKDSYEKIAKPLLERRHKMLHILLTADKAAVHDRILARGESEDCWCMQNIDMCIESQSVLDGVLRIDTTTKAADALAEEVAAIISAKKQQLSLL